MSSKKERKEKMEQAGYTKLTSVIYYLMFHSRDNDALKLADSLVYDFVMNYRVIGSQAISHAHDEARIKWYPNYFN